MAFAGIRGTGDWGTDERPKNFREGILWRQPNGSSPLFALMAKAKKQSINDPQFSWWEESLENVRVTVNDASGYSTGSLTLTIDSGGLQLVKGDLLLSEYTTETAAYDNEILEVSSVTNDTTIVVVRAKAGTTAKGIGDNTGLTRVGSAHEEGTTLPGISQRNPTKVTNFAQIFRTVFGVTKTADATFARTGDAYKTDKKRKAFDHSNKIEMAFLFGQSNETTSGTFPIRTTAGLRAFITTNRKIYTTSPTEDDFLDTVSPMFNFSKDTEAGNERIGLCGNGFLNNLNKVARNSSSSRINQDGTLKIYGMELLKYVLPQGTVAIKTHPLMSNHTVFTNSCFFLDFSNIAYRPLRDTKFEDNVQAPGEDSLKGNWITECGMQLEHELTAAYVGNFVV